MVYHNNKNQRNITRTEIMAVLHVVWMLFSKLVIIASQKEGRKEMSPLVNHKVNKQSRTHI